eukprot:g1971.t1
MGIHGGLPHTEFTVAKAAKKSQLGDYATIQLGKWHLGDLWDKKLPGMSPEKFSVSSPSDHGFDEWLTTQAEASNSMPNCGCFPVNHTHPGPQPPSGYSDITPHGDSCVVGGGNVSDWCYPCTNYYYPNASDVRKVTELGYKIPGDDSTFLVDHFEDFLTRQTQKNRPWLAHLCFHAIHEPHPAMPEFYDMYDVDPDYLGALSQWDAQVGRVLALLETHGVSENTAIFFTSDNGPHQGHERTDIRWSTNSLRQCKASMWEGGIRVPGAIHYPPLISRNLNVTTPATSADILPTIMALLQVESDNPGWIMDGMDLWPVLSKVGDGETGVPRSKLLGFDSTGGQHAIIDNQYKLLHAPGKGQCDYQAPYDAFNQTDLMSRYLLFNLESDPHELHDLSEIETEQFERMKDQLADFLASVRYSQVNETGCASYHDENPLRLGGSTNNVELPAWAYD